MTTLDRGIVLLLPLLALGPTDPVSSPARVPGQPRRIGSDKQLFIDAQLIESTRGVALTVNPPIKTGERNLVADSPWESFQIHAGTVLEDAGVFKMWYRALAFDSLDGPAVDLDALDDEARHTYMYTHIKSYLCHATSRDGIRWSKPTVNGVEALGSKRNNITAAGIEGTVFIDPNATGGNRFGLAGRIAGGFALWIWTSPDGLRWRPHRDRPILRKGPFDTQNQVFWDDRLRKYVAYVRRGSDKLNSVDLASIPYSEVFRLAAEGAADPAGQRKIGRAESADLARWPKDPEVVFSYDDRDPSVSDHYNPCVIKYPYAPDVYLAFPSAFLHAEGAGGALDVQLATSRDGVHWDRRERRPYLRLGVEGSADGGSIYMAVGMLRRGPELWMYYTGYDFRHGGFDLKTTRRAGVVSRVVQRLDGFVSADAAYDGGELTTVPLVFKGRELRLNTDTGALGALRVELLDEQGRALEGFRESECDAINGNFIDRRVTWRGSGNVGGLEGRVVRIRFVMRSAKLFAFRFAEAG